jgi:hypothetical protein
LVAIVEIEQKAVGHAEAALDFEARAGFREISNEASQRGCPVIEDDPRAL